MCTPGTQCAVWLTGTQRGHETGAASRDHDVCIRQCDGVPHERPAALGGYLMVCDETSDSVYQSSAISVSVWC